MSEPPTGYSFDRIGRLLPVEVGGGDEFKKRAPVLGAFATARCESVRRDGERAELRSVETSVQAAGKRCVRNDDEIVVADVIVECVELFRPRNWHAKNNSGIYS